MDGVIDLSLAELAQSFLILVLPLYACWHYRVKIIGSTLMAVLRMSLQLALVALYLEWVFALNSAWLNGLWVLIMVGVSSLTTIQRIGLAWRPFGLPLFLSGLTSLLLVDAFFLGYIIQLDYLFDARYLVPVSGMILGNALKHDIVGLSAYFNGLREKENLYYFLLTNTGSSKLALRPFMREALFQGLNPLVATMSVMGLVSLPGMMTGQILGGSSPATAIKYQIMIVLAIFTGCSLNLLLSIWAANRLMFDGYGRLKQAYFR
jgi:putative ABC transport system permease protein